VVAQATGAVAERYYYDAYGQAHFADDSWTEIEWDDSLQNEVLYGGYAFEAESGLYHTDAREYHCTLGRFVQVDPLGLAAGPNVYAYCNDSPADTVDPSGLEPDWAKAATGIMMVALSAMQTQAAISLGGSVFGMLGVTAGYGGFAAGMAMIVSAFSPDPRLDQVAETGAMIQLAASTPAFGASVIAAGGSMLRRAGAVLNGGVRSVNPTVSGRAGITEGITGDFNLTKTVAGHLDRPYVNSPLTIREIMAGGKPIADPGGVPGALRWDVPGAFNGSNGTWQLVVEPKTNTVLHFVFEGAK
jgi:RHS repeat-associated protein